MGQRLRARILAVDPAAKTVALSLLGHLLAASSDCQLPAVGLTLLCCSTVFLTVHINSNPTEVSRGLLCCAAAVRLQTERVVASACPPW